MRNIFGSNGNLIVINDEGTVTGGGPNLGTSPRAYSRAISTHNGPRNQHSLMPRGTIVQSSANFQSLGGAPFGQGEGQIVIGGQMTSPNTFSKKPTQTQTQQGAMPTNIPLANDVSFDSDNTDLDEDFVMTLEACIDLTPRV